MNGRLDKIDVVGTDTASLVEMGLINHVSLPLLGVIGLAIA